MESAWVLFSFCCLAARGNVAHLFLLHILNLALPVFCLAVLPMKENEFIIAERVFFIFCLAN